MNLNSNALDQLKEEATNAVQIISIFFKEIKMVIENKKKLRKKQILKLERIYFRAFLAGSIGFRQWYELKLACLILGLHKFTFF